MPGAAVDHSPHPAAMMSRCGPTRFKPSIDEVMVRLEAQTLRRFIKNHLPLDAPRSPVPCSASTLSRAGFEKH